MHGQPLRGQPLSKVSKANKTKQKYWWSSWYLDCDRAYFVLGQTVSFSFLDPEDALKKFIMLLVKLFLRKQNQIFLMAAKARL